MILYIMNLRQHMSVLSRNNFLKKHNLYKKISSCSHFSANKINYPSINMNNANNIVWIDMELTGLDIENDTILEIGCLVTNGNLELISPTFHTVIHQSDDILNKMNNWCKNTHAETGLINEVKKSNVNIKEAETQLLNFLKPFTVEKSCPLAGNTIWMDRVFLRKYMSVVDEYLNYRIIDVSSIKELCKRWNPKILIDLPEKKLMHRTVSDIEESIEELRNYRKRFFNII